MNETSVQRARTGALAALRDERDDLTKRRAYRFLIFHTAIISVALLIVLAAGLAGALERRLFLQSLVFCGVTGLMTAIGWVRYRRKGARGAFVLTFLYSDSLVAMTAYYLMGEFETPFLGSVVLLVIMAPLFAKRRHAYGIAAFQCVLYAVFLAGRYSGWFPYSAIIPGDILSALNDHQFIVDCFSGFLIFSFGAAYLAGEASIEITVSQKHLEEEVAARTEQLAQANLALTQHNAELEQFNAAVSHDLKSPLTSARLAAELLRDDSEHLSPDQKENIELIGQSVRRMNALIVELLNLSRLGTNLGEVSAVDLNEVLADIRVDLAALFQERSARFETGEMPCVAGNRELLRDALQNLVENAIKYGHPDGPTVRIDDVSGDAEAVTLAVEDNGFGIREEDRSRVFRPFVQLDSGASGVGVGLAITRRIIQLHKGSISLGDGVQSTGLRVMLDLPRATQEGSDEAG